MRHNLIGPRGRDKLLSSDLFDYGIGVAGDAPYDRAAVFVRWFLWIFVVDDLVDAGSWEHSDSLEAFARTALAARHAPELAPNTDPTLRVLAEDLWPSTARLDGGAEWLDTFAESVSSWLLAEAKLDGIRRGQRPLRRSEYLEFRRLLSGMDMAWDLLVVMTEFVSPVGDVDKLTRCASDIVSWTNDLCGIERDLSFGEPNLVTLIKDETACSWQEAVDAVHDRYRRSVQEFQAECAVPTDEATAAYRRRLCDAVATAVGWHQSSTRYLQANTGTVDVEQTAPSLFWRQFDRDPYPLYARLRDHFPVVWDESMETWLVSRYEDVRTALTELSSKPYEWQLAPVAGVTMLQLDEPEHLPNRKLVSGAFHGRTLDRWAEATERIVGLLVGRLHGKDQVDLFADFCRELPLRVMLVVFGIPETDLAKWKTWTDAITRYFGNYRQDPELLQAGLRARQAVSEYLDRHIAERRRAPGDDLLSDVCGTVADGERLTDEMIKAFCTVLIAAGTETAYKGLASLVANLLDHPDVAAAVAGDRDLARQVWVESIRKDSPVQLANRYTVEDFELAGTLIPAGATVTCLLGSANRDPSRYPLPERFDIHRGTDAADEVLDAAGPGIAFGAGRHTCLGAQLTHIEARAAMSALLDAMPRMRWADGFRPAHSGRVLRGPRRLLVTTGW
ncbi:hypothetical protein DMC64_36815 [Amycolatopsis sp. WAC 04197]|nr:hypothetical protein DMC64_36815 [Amycolatopsis sp. WAC 04197]